MCSDSERQMQVGVFKVLAVSLDAIKRDVIRNWRLSISTEILVQMYEQRIRGKRDKLNNKKKMDRKMRKYRKHC